MNTPLTDQLDEQAARLLKAIEQARAELQACQSVLNECAEVLAYSSPSTYIVYGNTKIADAQRKAQEQEIERFMKLRITLKSLIPNQPALITLEMALEEHKARLVDHAAPSHLAALWESEKEIGE